MNRTNRLVVDSNVESRQRKKQIRINSKPIEQRKKTISNESNKSSFGSKKYEPFGDKIKDDNKKIWNKNTGVVNQNVKNPLNSFRPQRQKMLFQNNNKHRQDNKKKQQQPIHVNKQHHNQQPLQPKRKFIMKKSNFENPPPVIQIKDDSSQEGVIHQIDKSNVNFQDSDTSNIPQKQQIKKSQKISIKKQQRSKRKQGSKKYQQLPVHQHSKQRNKSHKQQTRQERKKSQKYSFEQNPETRNRNHNSKGRDLVLHKDKSKHHQKRQSKQLSHPIFNHYQQTNPVSKRYKQQQQKRLKQFEAIIQSKRDAFNKINQHLDIHRSRYPVYIEFDMLADRVIRGSYRNYQTQVDRVNRQSYGSNIRKIQQVIRDIEEH